MLAVGRIRHLGHPRSTSYTLRPKPERLSTLNPDPPTQMKTFLRLKTVGSKSVAGSLAFIATAFIANIAVLRYPQPSTTTYK
jgi:hypothetical protein